MSHIHQGPLATYNSLTDGHLSGYFSNTRMRRHLRKSGLISKQGEIVSESTYRLNMSRKEHKKQVKDMLAQAIVHKTLDLERTRQAEIKKKLEEISKIQLVRRVREERTKVYEEMVLPLLSPRQGQGQTVLSARMKMKQSPRFQSTNTIPATHDRASTGRRGDEEILPYLTPRSRRPGSSPAFKPKGQKTQSKLRPNSAPGVRSESRHSEISVEEEGDVLYLDDDGRPITPAHLDHQVSGEQSHIDSRHLHTLGTAAIRKYAMLMSQMEEGRGVTSPYMMSQVPLPPKARMSKQLLSSRRVQSASPKRPVTTTDGRIARLHRPETAKAHPGDQQTMCRVLMKYHGWALNLAREKMDPRQEVVVEQQHCGGNTLTVFKEWLTPGSTFEFISYRHRGYPFSLTLYLDGQMDSRVSTCCEYRHSRGAKIGGKQGHFSVLSVEGAIPCYKCQVAKGVLVRNKATPRKSKRPSERHMEEVIVVATKKDDDDDYEDDDEGTERRTKQAKPVGEEDSAVLIPVERDEEENEDKTPKSTTERDTTYDDDFEDDKSASSKSSSESDSESESSRSGRKDEDYNCSTVRNKERGREQPAEQGPQSRESACHGAHSSRRRSAADRGSVTRPHQQSPERAAFTDTVDSCHSRSPSPDSFSSSPQPRKHRRRKKAKAAAEDVMVSPRPRDDAADKPDTKVTKEEESPGRQQQTTGEIGPVPVKEAADTADEVSDIESEVASPGRLYANSQLATEPEAAVSPKHSVPEVCEEQDGMPEEVGSCRGEDDALKKDVDSESRGDDEKQMRLLIIQSNDCQEAVKRKGLWNENRSKSQHPSTPQRTPRSPTSPRTPRSLLVHGMELTDPSSVSSSAREECSHSSVSQSCDVHSETYTKLMQEEERALPGDVEPGSLNGYTLSGSKRVIKRSKAVRKRRRRPAPPRSVTGKEPSSVVEVEQPMKIPQLSVGAPAHRDGSSGGGQLEMVMGTEPSSREFLQDDIYILQDTPNARSHSTNLAAHTLETEGTSGQDSAHAEKESARMPASPMHEGAGSQCETTGDNRAVKGEQEDSAEGNEVPAIVISSVPEAFISFHPPPKTVLGRRLEQEMDVHERGCENVWQNEENGGPNDADCAHVSEHAGYGPENYIRKSGDMDTALHGDRRTMDEEGDERKGDAVINIVCQEPDSPPADNSANNMDAEISISRVRRLSVELGTEEESIVLAHLRRHSVDGADGGAVFPQQPGLAADAADHSGEDVADGGQRFQRRRQSSLTVPLEAEALKLADRWIMEQDFPKQPKGGPCHQKKTVTWTQACDHEDESKDTVSSRKGQEREGMSDVQADLEEHPGEQGIRVYVFDTDHDATGDSREIFPEDTSGNVNEGKEGEPPVADDLMNIDNNMVEPGMNSANENNKSSQKDNAEDLYNDNDFENDDSKSSSSSASSTSSSSSSSNSWTSDSSSSSSISDSDSSSSSTSQASPATLKPTAPPGKATGPTLSVLSVAECLLKNRGLKTGQQVDSDSTPHLHPMTSPTPGSKAAEHGHTPESENETSDLDKSITKENDLQKETQNQNGAELSPQATDSKENDEQLNIQTISTSFPRVLVSYPDVQVFDDDGQKVLVKDGADDKEERSDVDSACDAKTASTTSLKGSVAKLVEDIEEEEKVKDIYGIPPHVLL